MKFIRFYFFISLFLATVSFSVTSYAIDFFEDENVIWKSGYNSFVFKDIDTKSLGTNQHPVQLQPLELSNALKSLKIQEEGFAAQNQDPEPLFMISTAQRLAEFIVKGLERAKPNQDIFFIVQAQKKQLLILTKKYVTSGRAFYRDGKLNIIIGDYQKAINDELERVLDPGDTGNSATLMGLDYAERDGQLFGGFDLDVIKLRGVENMTIKNKTRKDWFVFDVPQASESYLTLAKQGKKTDAERNLEVETAKLAKQRRDMRAEMARMRQDIDKIEGGSGSTSAKSIEERMVILEELRSKKLISQDEYDAKRQAILNDI